MCCPTAMRHFATFAGLVMMIGSFGIASGTAQPNPQIGNQQFRAYWVDSFNPGLYSEAEIDRLVADARAANMNAIVAQVVRRADCFCNRSIMPRTEAELGPPPFDPLQMLIQRAHAAGLEVHAWLNTTIMWASDVPPRDPAHVFHAHGPSAAGRDNWVMLRRDGANRGANLYFFDPGHPDAAGYIASMYLSIVTNYDIDGINFDYVRYPDYNPAPNVPAWGYNPVAVARFQAVSGRRDVPEPTDPQWMDWRREQVTNLVRRVYLETARIRPHIRVSADTITYGSAPASETAWIETRAYREVLQDWRAWMQEGILDLNIPMNYRREQATTEPSNFRRMYEEWSDFIKDHQYGRQAAVGTALYLNPIEDSVIQIRKALSPSPAGNVVSGWVGFSYYTPDALVNDRRRPSEEARAELSRALTQRADDSAQSTAGRPPEPVFPFPVPTPGMPWKLAPATGHLRGTVTTSTGAAADQYLVTLTSTMTGALAASRRTDGSGWFGFVDLQPGPYRISVEPRGEMPAASMPVAVTAGRVAPVALVLPSVAPREREDDSR